MAVSLLRRNITIYGFKGKTHYNTAVHVHHEIEEEHLFLSQKYQLNDR